jgi:peptide/nickel transport system substrate-binding protein
MAYPNAVEAYRKDHIESITTMPSSAGNIYGQDGYWSWWSAVPADSGGSSGGSSSTGVVIGFAAGGVVLVGLAVLFAVRRRASADERE